MAIYVEPPAAPQPAPGLLTPSALLIGPIDMPSHGSWDGIEYRPDACGVVHGLPTNWCDDEGEPIDPIEKTFDDMPDLVQAYPFLLYASSTCGLPGMRLTEHEARVRRLLLAKEQWGVERAFWGGYDDVPGYLQQLALTPLGATDSVTTAVSMLEQALADAYGLPGVVHARAGMAAYFGTASLLQNTPSNQLARTWKGNQVVFGDGYGDADEGGDPQAAGTATLFITGRVTVWRAGDTFVPTPRQVVDRATNQTYILAEREYAIAHECAAFAVTVTGLDGGA